MEIEISSVKMLSKHLIFFAVQRCRMSDDICRLTVKLISFSRFGLPLVRFSVSDTGVGSKLEEYQYLKYRNDPVLVNQWDGIISLATTIQLVVCIGGSLYKTYSAHTALSSPVFSFVLRDVILNELHKEENLRQIYKAGDIYGVSDSEIHNLNLNLKESNSAGRLTKLPSAAKNGVKFSGTEVSVSISKSLDDLLAEMILVKIPKVVMELLVGGDDPLASQIESRILAIEGSSVYSPVESIKCLEVGLKDYVRKHHTCFSTGENMKAGTGVANSSGSSQGNSQVVEAVVIICEISELFPSSCTREQDMKTEIIYFKDFVPCSVAQSSVDALTSINWKSYGLALRSVADHDGCVMLEWENLPPYFSIHIAMHCYHRQVKQWVAQNGLPDRNLARKAVKCALDDLKENNQGVLLSTRALKICDYAPDLAKTLARLILSSNDLNFQEECCSLLGVKSQEVNMDNVGNCIREKIISVIRSNDCYSQKHKEVPSFLFEDDYLQKVDLMDEEYQEGEEVHNSLDL